MPKTISVMESEANTLLPDNTDEQISAMDVRDRFLDIYPWLTQFDTLTTDNTAAVAANTAAIATNTSGLATLQAQVDGLSSDVTSVFGRSGAVLAVAGDYEASEITVTPSGNLGSNNVQAALIELQDAIDSVAATGGTVASVFGRQGTVVAVAGDYDATEVTYAPTGNTTATTVQGAINELQTDIDTILSGGVVATSVFGRTGAVVAVAGDYLASQITVTPAGNLTSTTVQLALVELQTDIDNLSPGNDQVTINDVDLAVPGSPTDTDAQQFASNNSLTNVTLQYIGSGNDANPDWMWLIDDSGIVNRVKYPITGAAVWYSLNGTALAALPTEPIHRSASIGIGSMYSGGAAVMAGALNLGNEFSEDRFVVWDGAAGGRVSIGVVEATGPTPRRLNITTDTDTTEIMLGEPGGGAEWFVIGQGQAAFTRTEISPGVYVGYGNTRTNGTAPRDDTLAAGTNEPFTNVAYFGTLGQLYQAPASKITGIPSTNITVTPTGNLAATDVQAALEELQTDMDGIGMGLIFKGEWDASSGVFPGSGVAQTGWFYKVTTGGTVDGVAFTVGDSLYASIDNASTTTFAGNWVKVDSIDAITTVFGRTGAILAVAGDYTANLITVSPAGNLTSVDVQAALEELQADIDTLSGGGITANITEGTLDPAIADRPIDLGGNEINFLNVTNWSVTATGNWTTIATAATVNSGTFTVQNSNSATPGGIRLREAANNGINYVQIVSPADLSVSWDLTLPPNPPASDNMALVSTTAGLTSWSFGLDQVMRTIAPGDLTDPTNLAEVGTAMTTTQSDPRDEWFKFIGSGTTNNPDYVWHRTHNTNVITIIRDPSLVGGGGDPEFLLSDTPLTGAAPAGYAAGYDRVAKINYIVNSSGDWEVDPDGQPEKTITDGEITTPGSPTNTEAQALATAGDWKNTYIQYIGTGSDADPQYAWYVDSAGEVSVIKAPGIAELDQQIRTIQPIDLTDPTNLTDVELAMTATQLNVRDEWFRFVGGGSENDPDWIWHRDHGIAGTNAVTIIRSPTSSGGTYERVATLGARASAASQADGFESKVEENQVLYVVRNGAYETKSTAVSNGTLAERLAITNHVDGQIFYDRDLGEWMRWDASVPGTADEKWVVM